MDNLISKSAPLARTIGMALLFAAAAFGLVVNGAGIGGGFMPVLGGLLSLIFDLAVVVCVPLLLVLKRDDLLRWALAPVLAYWVIATIYNFLGGADVVTGNYNGLTIARGLFQFFIAAAFLGIVVLLLLYVLRRNRKMINLSFCVLAGSLVLFVVLWGLSLGAYAKYNADWSSYLYAFKAYIFMPIGYAATILAYFGGGIDTTHV